MDPVQTKLCAIHGECNISRNVVFVVTKLLRYQRDIRKVQSVKHDALTYFRNFCLLSLWKKRKPYIFMLDWKIFVYGNVADLADIFQFHIKIYGGFI